MFLHILFASEARHLLQLGHWNDEGNVVLRILFPALALSQEGDDESVLERTQGDDEQVDHQLLVVVIALNALFPEQPWNHAK